MVSIVIPLHNCESFIKQAIESCLSQTYREIEVIIVDDGSVDKGLEIAKMFGDRVQCHAGPNRGGSAARNRGIASARGEFLVFLDADDYLVENAIEVQLNISAQFTEEQRTIAYGNARKVDVYGNPIGDLDFAVHPKDMDPVLVMLTKNPVTTCPLHRRKFLEDVGGFDETLPRGQESDLHLRLALAGVKFFHHPDIVYYYRQHQSAHRITDGVASRFGRTFGLDYVKKRHGQLRKKFGEELPLPIAHALSQHYWREGRAILREGYPDIARECFVEARALGKSRYIAGEWQYRAICGFIGPFRAEKLCGLLRRPTTTAQSDKCERSGPIS